MVRDDDRVEARRRLRQQARNHAIDRLVGVSHRDSRPLRSSAGERSSWERPQARRGARSCGRPGVDAGNRRRRDRSRRPQRPPAPPGSPADPPSIHTSSPMERDSSPSTPVAASAPVAPPRAAARWREETGGSVPRSERMRPAVSSAGQVAQSPRNAPRLPTRSSMFHSAGRRCASEVSGRSSLPFLMTKSRFLALPGPTPVSMVVLLAAGDNPRRQYATERWYQPPWARRARPCRRSFEVVHAERDDTRI